MISAPSLTQPSSNNKEICSFAKQEAWSRVEFQVWLIEQLNFFKNPQTFLFPCPWQSLFLRLVVRWLPEQWIIYISLFMFSCGFLRTPTHTYPLACISSPLIWLRLTYICPFWTYHNQGKLSIAFTTCATLLWFSKAMVETIRCLPPPTGKKKKKSSFFLHLNFPAHGHTEWRLFLNVALRLSLAKLK